MKLKLFFFLAVHMSHLFSSDSLCSSLQAFKMLSQCTNTVASGAPTLQDTRNAHAWYTFVKTITCIHQLFGPERMYIKPWLAICLGCHILVCLHLSVIYKENLLGLEVWQGISPMKVHIGVYLSMFHPKFTHLSPMDHTFLNQSLCKNL